MRPQGVRDHAVAGSHLVSRSKFEVLSVLIYLLPFMRPQGVRDHAVAGSHLVSRSKFEVSVL